MRTTIVTAILITVAVGLLGFATPADAFCVYNDDDADKPVKFSTGSGQGAHFNSQWPDPGKNSCCHWSNVMCNGSKEQKALVSMSVIVRMPAEGGLGFHPDLNCGHFQFEDRTTSCAPSISTTACGTRVSARSKQATEIAR